MNTKRYLEERRKREVQRRNLMLGLIIGGSILMLGAIVAASVGASRVKLSPEQIVRPDFSYTTESEQNALGDPNAPVVIHEYSDFGCGHCANFALGTKQRLEEEYIQTGNVYLVFHSVGALVGSPSTIQAAEAAYCAADQDAFWQYHDLLYANQVALFSKRGANIIPTLEIFADLLGLDPKTFNDCITGGKYQSLLSQDNVDARSSNISGTPSFLINGELLVGNQPYENFQEVIEEALAR
jgi:protein-disulfide isomerase